jgi:hypothetical protein
MLHAVREIPGMKGVAVIHPPLMAACVSRVEDGAASSHTAARPALLPFSSRIFCIYHKIYLTAASRREDIVPKND